MHRDGSIDGPATLGLLREWAAELGFSQIGVAGVDLSAAEPGLLAWLDAGFHGTMAYMAAHGLRRARPAELVPGTVSVITARMDYLPRRADTTLAQARAEDTGDGAAQGPQARSRAAQAGWQRIEWARLARPEVATVSMYARGRDYHKVLRGRLQALADRLAAHIGPFGHRVFTDSAPVLEAELAVRSGLGWRGKHTLVLAREGGSMGFIGELFVDFALPASAATLAHCGSCTACLDLCPTQAIVAPYRLDARRCISYLTIEHDGPIPAELRPLIGNRIYGCDDCQLACPWNRHARPAVLADFDVRADLAEPTLAGLWGWSEADFLRRTEGSAIRRIGWRRWRRNLAVAAGNALAAGHTPPAAAAALREALSTARSTADPLVAEHIDWALAQGVARP